jgi:hypothetical protein
MVIVSIPYLLNIGPRVKDVPRAIFRASFAGHLSIAPILADLGLALLHTGNEGLVGYNQKAAR